MTKKKLEYNAKNLNDFDAVMFYTGGSLEMDPRLKLIHLKDIQASGGEVNVMLGSGKCRIPEVMRELRRIGFQGLVALEYEKDGDINDEVRQQLAFARRLAVG